MAALPNADRAALATEIQRSLSEIREPLGALTKAELRAAINGADDWADANAASYNTALPQPARSALTARQKARLLMFVIRRRFEVS